MRDEEKPIKQESPQILNVINESRSEREQNDDASVTSSSQHHHGGGVGTKERAAQRERETLAKRENRAVATLRIIVFAVLFLTAISVSTAVYLFSHNDELDNFDEVFEAYATRILESYRESMENQLSVFDSLSVTITSFALATGATFPNVTLPHFELRGTNTRILADSFFCFFAPLVTNETKAGWEAYTSENILQHHEAYERQDNYIVQQNEEYDLDPIKTARPEPTNFTSDLYPYKIYTSGPPSPYPDEYLFPAWQDSPYLPPELSFLNFDISAIRPGIQQTRITHKAHLDPMVQVTERLKQNVNSFIRDGQFRGNLDAYADDPMSPFSYPVFDSFDVNTRKIVGILGTNLYWRLYWVNVLPPNAVGVICVLSDGNGSTHSYRVDGPVVTYLGEGDHHDKKFDNMGQSQELVDFVTNEASPETRGYTAAQVNPGSTKHYLHVYPSDDLRDQHVTNRPVIFASVVLMVFIFTSIVFVIYDYLVERRQTVVMDRAVKSSAVVSSLFPETVRDRLLQDNQGEQQKTSSSKNDNNKAANSRTNNVGENDSRGNKLSIMASFGLSSNMKEREQVENATSRFSGPPIADKFINATVLFADIAGFTQWSSERKPEHVFHLLETLYGAFDDIALRRRVFKVETIGDCYMAVTGVPKAQTDHASIMARFAMDCIRKMQSLIQEELSDALGQETLSLAMRVGLNSGEVTAGVLRGEKSRFQLFGDAVNTAARMESTGERGRIHCSESTANELIRVGKGNWVEPREGTVSVKGKGEMQTYFIDPRNKTLSRTSLSTVKDGVCDGVTKTEGTILSSEGTPSDGGSSSNS